MYRQSASYVSEILLAGENFFSQLAWKKVTLLPKSVARLVGGRKLFAWAPTLLKYCYLILS